MRIAALSGFRRVSAVLGFLAAVAAAEAPPAGPVVPIPHPTTMLLRAKTVGRELGLGNEQAEGVARLVEEAELPLWRLRDLPAAERDRAAAPILESLRADLDGVLAERQLGRLDQLVLQAQGVGAVFDPRVADVLRLTGSQQQRIREVLVSATRNANPVETRRRAQAILTPSQQRVLASQGGPPFDLSGVPQIACRAPEFEGVTDWINSSPLALGRMRGKVVVVHYYAFGCINCIRNLPHYNGWFDRFRRDQVAIVGIHRPETDAERDVGQVRRKIAEAGIRYPVAVDNESRNWNAWVNRVWPSVYLIDKKGFVRYWWYGELNWQGAQGEAWMRARIAELIAEPSN